MAALKSKVRGTLKTANDVLLAQNTVVTFEPLGAPYVSGGEVILGSFITATIDANGQFGYSPLFWLVEGYYKVVVRDRGSFTIQVPGDNATHELDDLAVDLGSHTEVLSRRYTYQELLDVTADSKLIKRRLKGDPAADFVPVVVFGGGPMIADSLVSYALSFGATEAIALGDMNTGGAAGTVVAAFAPFLDWARTVDSEELADNSFWYAHGKQDWLPGNVTAVTDYLELNGNERYYAVTLASNCTLFVLSSRPDEPDGVGVSSTQMTWLQAQLAASTTKWNLVAFYDAPTCSKSGYTNTWMASIPFASWGADMVFASGDTVNFYERITLGDGTPLFVVGSCANPIGTPTTPVTGSQYIYSTKRGFLALKIGDAWIKTCLINEDGLTVDQQTIEAPDGSIVNFEALVWAQQGLRQSASGLLIDAGSADGQVLSGNSLWQTIQTGRIIPFTSAPPTAEQVRQNPWWRNCLFLVGDDPASIYYWNKANSSVDLFAIGNEASVWSGARTQLAVPTFSPTSGVTYGTVVSHVDATVTIRYSVNGAIFGTVNPFTSGSGKIAWSRTDRKVWVAAYAVKTGYLDSEIAIAQFTPPL